MITPFAAMIISFYGIVPGICPRGKMRMRKQKLSLFDYAQGKLRRGDRIREEIRNN